MRALIAPPLRTRLVSPIPAQIAVGPAKVVHRLHCFSYTSCGGCTVGWARGSAVVDMARRLDWTWCRDLRCFPGRRCDLCGVPSGGHIECYDHVRAAIAVDKAFARTDS